MRVCLLFLLCVPLASLAPIADAHSHEDHDDTAGDADPSPSVDTVVLQPPTSFTVERLDAPMERIEIRLIDEHANETEHHDGAAVEQVHSEHAENHEELPTDRVENGSRERVEEESADRHAPATENSPAEELPDKYRKVEYVSHDGRDDEQRERDERDDAAEREAARQGHVDASVPPEQLYPAAETINADEYAEERERGEGVRPRWIDAAPEAARLSELANRGDIGDDDIAAVPVDENDDNEEDESRDSEECLLNRDELPSEVVTRLQEQATKLTRMIRRLNKKQQRACKDRDDASHMRDNYRQCPIWREEKMVHYYKLMRITYCADYNKWPNVDKLRSTYGQYLPLFETLYAFQKQ